MMKFLKKVDLLTRLSLLLFLGTAVVFAVYFILIVLRKDTVGPVITIKNSRIELSVQDNTLALMEGVNAIDNRDGDVTSSIMIESLSNLINGKERIVTYAAVDKSHNVTTAKRTAVYTDYISPEFHLSGPLCYQVRTADLISGITVFDYLDGDITNSIRIISDDDFNMSIPGVYDITFQASNSAGDVAELKTKVELYNDYTARQIDILLKDYVVYINKDSYFDPKDYLESAVLNGIVYRFVDGPESYGDPNTEIKKQTIGVDRVSINGVVNTSEPGGYEIMYSLTMTTTSGDQVSGRIYLPVIVRDN